MGGAAQPQRPPRPAPTAARRTGTPPEAAGRYHSASAMANIHSQKKRILRTERERLENRRYTSTIKTYFRRLEAAAESGDADLAATEHRELISLIDRAVKRGAMHRNTGARKKARATRLHTSITA